MQLLVVVSCQRGSKILSMQILRLINTRPDIETSQEDIQDKLTGVSRTLERYLRPAVLTPSVLRSDCTSIIGLSSFSLKCSVHCLIISADSVATLLSL